MNFLLVLLLAIPAALAAGCGGEPNSPGRKNEGEDGGSETPTDAGLGSDTMLVCPEGCYTVSRYVDGDTFNIEIRRGVEQSVRLLRIDTPERNEECFGRASSALRSFLEGQCVRLDIDPRADETDQWGRWLRWVSLCGEEETGTINIQMVEGGWACLFFETGLPLEAVLREAQDRAEAAGIGCWDQNPNFCD